MEATARGQAGPTHARLEHLFVFRVDDRRYGLPVTQVECAIRAVAVTPLPGSPKHVLGVVDYHGEIIAVLDPPASGLGAWDRPVRAAETFLIGRLQGRRVAVRVDRAQGVMVFDRQRLYTPDGGVTGTPWTEGVSRLDSGLLLIYDLDAFLTHDELSDLDSALDDLGEAALDEGWAT